MAAFNTLVPRRAVLSDLRVAIPADILRLAVVSAAGFWYSEDFQWTRPFHADYPSDTIAGYANELSEFVRSAEHVVLVTTDCFDPEESLRTGATIPAEYGCAPKAGCELVVGYAVWGLHSGSERVGHFQDDLGHIQVSDFHNGHLDGSHFRVGHLQGGHLQGGHLLHGHSQNGHSQANAGPSQTSSSHSQDNSGTFDPTFPRQLEYLLTTARHFPSSP